MPSPMSRRKARSWPSARAAARSRITAVKAAVDREKTVAITDFASEPWGKNAKTSVPRAQQARTAVGGMRGTRGSRNLPASELCNSQPSRTRTNQSYHPRALRGQPGGRTSYVKVRPFGGRGPRGAAHGIHTSWEQGADGLRVCLGCMTFGQEADEETSREIV